MFTKFLNSLTKSSITKKINNNAFERITYQHYILLLFDFIFDFQIKHNNFVNLNDI